jgi:transcription termination/antitermination protein NusG
MIYTIKTVVGRENVVLDAISSKIVPENLKITAMVHPEEIKGYIFVEGEITDIERATTMIPHIRGLIKKAIDPQQLQRFLQPKEVEVELDVGDIVEVIGGPFKGEKGKITRYDKTKRECTIELLEVTTPIPLTVSVEFVKILSKIGK